MPTSNYAPVKSISYPRLHSFREVEESPIQKDKVENEDRRSGEEDVGDVNKEKVEEEVEEKEPEAKVPNTTTFVFIVC